MTSISPSYVLATGISADQPATHLARAWEGHGDLLEHISLAETNVTYAAVLAE